MGRGCPSIRGCLTEIFTDAQHKSVQGSFRRSFNEWGRSVFMEHHKELWVGVVKNWSKQCQRHPFLYSNRVNKTIVGHAREQGSLSPSFSQRCPFYRDRTFSGAGSSGAKFWMLNYFEKSWALCWNHALSVLELASWPTCSIQTLKFVVSPVHQGQFVRRFPDASRSQARQPCLWLGLNREIELKPPPQYVMSCPHQWDFQQSSSSPLEAVSQAGVPSS